MTIKYTMTNRPTKVMIRLVAECLNLYFSGCFKFKPRPHIQNGNTNSFYLVDLSRDLPKERKWRLPTRFCKIMPIGHTVRTSSRI